MPSFPPSAWGAIGSDATPGVPPPCINAALLDRTILEGATSLDITDPESGIEFSILISINSFDISASEGDACTGCSALSHERHRILKWRLRIGFA